MNLEDAWLVRRSRSDSRRENEMSSSRRSWGELERHFNPLDPKNEHHTPLITSPARILVKIDQHPSLQWPKGSEKGPQLPKSKYFYRYHREYGHDTNRCRQLRQEIERLIHT
ncbi:UNVERIFIED_CONTAM: hypothetical protein Slati_1945100 [Sesamum latifolium]|uniref:Uncharacterized protein n=1 Tax=Sesamum latifolium TaxID=2727402 RepID=A0AAW2X5Z2_9LAMI